MVCQTLLQDVVVMRLGDFPLTGVEDIAAAGASTDVAVDPAA